MRNTRKTEEKKKNRTEPNRTEKKLTKLILLSLLTYTIHDTRSGGDRKTETREATHAKRAVTQEKPDEKFHLSCILLYISITEVVAVVRQHMRGGVEKDGTTKGGKLNWNQFEKFACRKTLEAVEECENKNITPENWKC